MGGAPQHPQHGLVTHCVLQMRGRVHRHFTGPMFALRREFESRRSGSLAGWFRLRHLSKPAAESIAVILMSFPLIYYVVNWSSRYRMPIEWALVLLAGVALGGVYDTFMGRRRENPE